MSNPRLHKRKKKKSVKIKPTEKNIENNNKNKKLKHDHVRSLKSTEKYIIVAIAIFCIAGISISYGVNQYVTNHNQTTNSGSGSTTTTPYSSDFIVTTIEGVSYNLSQFRNEAVVLCFMSLNQTFYQSNQTLYVLNKIHKNPTYSTEAKIFAIDSGADTINTLQEYKTNNFMTIDFCKDPNHALWTHFSILNMPTTLVLDKNGNINKSFYALSDTTYENVSNIISAIYWS